MELKRIDVASCAKVAGILYALMGLLFGALFSIVSLMGAAFAGGTEGGLAGLFFGIGAIIVLPLFYGALGAVFAALGAALYNVVAGRVGGIRLDLS